MAKDDMSRRSFMQKGIAAGTVAMMAQAGVGAEGSEPVSVAVVGCAHIHTPQCVSILKGRKDVRVKSVWDHDEARAKRRAAELSAPVARSAEEIWQDPQIKAVAIYSETDRHRDLVLAGAKAGKHMFIEKPLGTTAKDSQEMADAIEKANVLFTTGYFFRCQPGYQFAKEQVEKGTLGKITRIRGSNAHDGSLGGWFDNEWRWMADPKQAGVGAFGDLGTHSLDILMWLMGDVEAATADIKVVTGRYGDCDESGEALMRFKNGVTGTVAAGWVDRADPVTLLISGTEGHLSIINGQVYFRSNKVQGADGGKPWKELPKGRPHPLEMFFNAVVGQQGQSLVRPSEAAARVRVMEAMYRGSSQRAWVTIA